jgi:hypothetical protein
VAPAGLANYYEPSSDLPAAGAAASAKQETPKPPSEASDSANQATQKPPREAPDSACTTPQRAEPKTAPPAKMLASPAGPTGLLNEKETAALLGLEPATLRNWRVKGQAGTAPHPTVSAGNPVQPGRHRRVASQPRSSINQRAGGRQ